MSKANEGIREQQKRERADLILGSARDLVAEVGYDQMTMDMLASRAGVTKPTLYAYFPTKESIAVASVVRMIRHGIATLDTADVSRTPLARLDIFVRQVLSEKFVARRHIFGGFPVPAIRAHPDYREALHELLARLVALIDAGQKDGSVDPNLEPEIAVRIFMSVLRDHDYAELIRDGRVEPAAMIETMATLFLRGLKAKS